MKKVLSIIFTILIFTSCVYKTTLSSQPVSSSGSIKINQVSSSEKIVEKNNKNNDVKARNEKKNVNLKSKEEKTQKNVKKDEIKVKLIISKNNRQDILYEKVLKLEKPMTAMQILKQNTKVYEVGGFIKEINGLISIPQNQLSDEDKEKGILGYDWFIYLNGKKTKVGANDIVVKDGDILNFDYKGWTVKDLMP
ncbi:protein of unknown function [Caloramator fervidus]|uniref:Transcobalamin-like C-terminal domain-containing protein n=1 Tax=Caloramator fervidus TaxID=29344 RepID=A0A1H5SLD6_9CLOT|nr:DUF4430 domain-containing protein [Caloramator fervidus]SEF50661.1 protein of unknown function [Caloramator fervidus]